MTEFKNSNKNSPKLKKHKNIETICIETASLYRYQFCTGFSIFLSGPPSLGFVFAAFFMRYCPDPLEPLVPCPFSVQLLFYFQEMRTGTGTVPGHSILFLFLIVVLVFYCSVSLQLVSQYNVILDDEGKQRRVKKNSLQSNLFGRCSNLFWCQEQGPEVTEREERKREGIMVLFI